MTAAEQTARTYLERHDYRHIMLHESVIAKLLAEIDRLRVNEVRAVEACIGELHVNPGGVHVAYEYCWSWQAKGLYGRCATYAEAVAAVRRAMRLEDEP